MAVEAVTAALAAAPVQAATVAMAEISRLLRKR
jgi:hypothetical protein